MNFSIKKTGRNVCLFLFIFQFVGNNFFMNEPIFEKLGQKICSKLINDQNKENEVFQSENFQNLFLPKYLLNLKFKNSFIFEFPVLADKLKNQNYVSEIKGKFDQILTSNVGTIILSIKDFNLKSNLHTNIVNEFFAYVSKASHAHAINVVLEISMAYGRTDKTHLWLKKFKISASTCKDEFNSKLPRKHPSDNFLNKLSKQIASVLGMAGFCGFDGICLDLSSGIAGELSSFELNNLVFGKFSEPQDFALKILNETNKLFQDKPIFCRFPISTMILELFSNEFHFIRSVHKIKPTNNIILLTNFINLLINHGVDAFFMHFGTCETALLHDYPQFLGENLFEEFYDIFSSTANEMTFIKFALDYTYYLNKLKLNYVFPKFEVIKRKG